MTDATLTAAILAALPPWPEWVRLSEVVDRLNAGTPDGEPVPFGYARSWGASVHSDEIGCAHDGGKLLISRARPAIAIPVEARRVMGEAVRRG